MPNKRGEEGKRGNIQEIVQHEAARSFGSIYELWMNLEMAVSSLPPYSCYEQGFRTLIFPSMFGAKFWRYSALSVMMSQ